MIVNKDKERLDKYFADLLDVSRSKIQKLIEEEKVIVNGRPESSNYKVHLGDNVELIGELEEHIDLEKEDIPLDILYEDKYLAIINKKSGMVVHPGNGNYSHTLVNALLFKYNLDTSDLRPGIVHRIDKDTSGVMVVALDPKTQELLSEMIKNKEVERVYLALVNGIIMHETGDIDAPIGRDKNNREKMCVTDINSKEAFTHFRVLKRFKKANKTLVECKLKTGRTHQIRVHMAYIGHSIYNDPVYGNSKNTTEFGQFLHSHTIKFIHPITGKLIEYSAPLPSEFQEYLNSIEE